MKKIYQNPEIKMVNVQVAQMIAASQEVMETNSDGDALNEETSVASRRGSIWDDEE